MESARRSREDGGESEGKKKRWWERRRISGENERERMGERRAPRIEICLLNLYLRLSFDHDPLVFELLKSRFCSDWL